MRSVLQIATRATVPIAGVLRVASRNFSRSATASNAVTVVGSAGGIGQPLSLLFKQSCLVTDLRLYDVAPVNKGVGADLSHVDSPARVSAYVGDGELAQSLKGADMVIVPAGVPRKPGMTRDDLFNINASIVAGVARAVADNAPDALVLIISNPVNSTVPIFAEIMKRKKAYNPKRLFGVTTLDVVRANTFVAENQKLDVRKTNVNVIGGHAGITIIPLLSQVGSGAKFSKTDVEALTKRIMFGGDEVVQAKAGAGSATLSMAYAGAKFAFQVLRARNGARGLVECSFVDSQVVPNTQFFATPVELGKDGIQNVRGYGELSSWEEAKLKEALPELQASIKKGVEFARNFKL